MTDPVIHTFDSGDDLGRALAARIASRVEPALAERGHFQLGCPGGRTPTSTYAALAREFAARGLDLSGLRIVMMDDYIERDGDTWAQVDADAHYSCRRFAREDIQGVLNAGVSADRAIPDENVWFADPHDPAAYDGRIADAGGIDFFILASGAGDGHVAFNPPGSGVDSRTRIVTLAEQTRRDNLATFPDFGDLGHVPTHGLTMGIATIAELSHEAAMILIGPDKQEAYRRLTGGTGYDPQWPATVYHLISDAGLWVDSAAAGGN